MGCGVPSKLPEEEQLLRRRADAFRAKVVREVEANREKSMARNRNTRRGDEILSSTSIKSNRLSAFSQSHMPQDEPNIAAEARTSTRSTAGPLGEADPGQSHSGVVLRPLRTVCHLEHGSLVMGDRLVEHKGDISILVPGKVGCEDDKVVISGEDHAHMLLRTRRVHKHKRGAKKVFAQRRLTNLEDEGDEDRAAANEGDACRPLPEEEKRSLIKVLQRHFLTASLQREEHEMLAQQVVRLEMAKGAVICRKGEKGDSCYIIISGVCAVEKEREQVAQLSAGHTFGELAMLYDIPRMATIVCASPRVVICQIRGPSFRRCLARFKERTLSDTLGFLNGHEIFSKLAREEKRMFANALSPQVFEVGAVLIDEHISSSADWMFLVQEGTVEVTDQYKNRKVLGEGATFSGQRMPYGQKAMAAKAMSKLRVLAIGHVVMNRLFGNISEVLRRAMVRHILEVVGFFRELTDKQQLLVAAMFKDQHFRKGEVIVTAMADPQLVLVMEGEVLVVDRSVSVWDAVEAGAGSRVHSSELHFSCLVPAGDDRGAARDSGVPLTCMEPCDNEPEVELPHSRSLVKTTLKGGDIYGEDTFREHFCMSHSLVARTDVVVCRAGHDEVCRALRGHAEKTPPLAWIIQRNRIKEKLQKGFPFSALYEAMLDIVVEKFETVEYQFNEAIVQVGDTSRRFCLVIEGEALRQTGGGGLEPLARWSSFGACQLLLGKPVEADVVAAATGCTVKSIDTAMFTEACGVLFNELAAKMKYKGLHIQYSDIVSFGKLGEGQFGVVRRVCVRSIFGEDFALKRILKRTVLETDQQVPVKLEREILAECCHPLVVRLITTFQDEHSVYFLMENLTGGDLFTAIRDIGALNEEQTLFFGASIVLGVEYLHSRGVIYRDLKPENVMLLASGFLKLVDMGCCSRKVRSYTFVGTPEYLAPEVVLGKGYGQAVDWWAVGVIMYEMICGPLPFGEGCGDPLEVMREVLQKPLTIPTKVTPEASDLITSLLERMPEQRLGSSTLRMGSEVREHQFFELLQWDAILEHSTLPPYIPQKAPEGPKPKLKRAGSLPTCGTEKAEKDGSWEVVSPQGSVSVVSPRPSGAVGRQSLKQPGDEEQAMLSGGNSDSEEEEVPLPPDPEADLSCFEGF